MNSDDSKIFFVQTTPGLEELAIAELKLKWDSLQAPNEWLDSVTQLKGGFEISLPIEYGHALNSLLKIPNRILLRIATFRCRDAPKLFHKAVKIPWHLYLRGEIPEFSVTSHRSRLIHTKKIEEVIKSAIEKTFQARLIKKQFLEQRPPTPFTLFVRVENDDVTLSIDTSGERLHKRGSRSISGVAPIRENLASALILYSWLQYQKKDIRSFTLLDPCCGTGTFLFEAKKFFHFHERDFNYNYFPLIHNKPQVRLVPINTNYQFQGYMGKDILSEVINHNIQQDSSIHFIQEDLFRSAEDSNNHYWILSNPPYGKRAYQQESLNSFFNQMTQTYHPELIGLVMPFETKIFPREKNYRRISELRFSNGGISVKFQLWQKQSP